MLRGWCLAMALAAGLAAQPKSAQQIAQGASPSVVMVVTQNAQGQYSYGSGFVLRDGQVVTNCHVIAGATSGSVRLVDKSTEYEIAGTIGVDDAHDLAVVEARGLTAPPLPLGDSSRVAVGEEVFAIGNPKGFEGTFSAGMISAVRHVASDTIFQMTAPISPGSSGGPILNKNGEVVGIAKSTIEGGQNLNFAIPVSYLTDLTSGLSGEVRPLSPKGAKVERRSVPKPQEFTVDASTPEGQMLQTAGQTEDKAARIKVYEEYLAKFPQHGGVAWVCSLLAPLYVESGQHDKVLAIAAKGLALDPANAVMAHKALQACEAKKDAACIKDWSAKTAEAALKALAVKKPDDEDEAETWKREVDFAKQVIVYTEYSLYAAALTSADPKVKIDLGETLEKRNPKSQYMGMLAGPYFVALLQTGQTAPAAELVDRAAAGGYSNEDMLLFGADYQMQQKDLGKALAYTAKLIAELPAKAAPQGVGAADWEAKKNGTLARAHYMTGSAQCTQSGWAECDQAMRAALPLAQGNNDLLPGVYFYLGWANHELSKAQKDKVRRAEARKYFEACAKLKSPFQAQAIKNLNAILTAK